MSPSTPKNYVYNGPFSYSILFGNFFSCQTVSDFIAYINYLLFDKFCFGLLEPLLSVPCFLRSR